jgi:hypothetical protein
MLVYLASRIKMGGCASAGLLPCQPEDKKERAVKLFRRFGVDAADFNTELDR